MVSENVKAKQTIQKRINTIARSHDGVRSYPTHHEADESFWKRTKAFIDVLNDLTPSKVPTDPAPNVFPPLRCGALREDGLMYLCNQRGIPYGSTDRGHLVDRCCQGDPEQLLPALDIDLKLVRDYPPLPHPTTFSVGEVSTTGEELINHLEQRTSESVRQLVKDWVGERVEGEFDAVQIRGNLALTALNEVRTEDLKEWWIGIVDANRPAVRCNYKMTVWGTEFTRANRTELAIVGDCFIEQRKDHVTQPLQTPILSRPRIL